MSKSNSGHFSGTAGSRSAFKNLSQNNDVSGIIPSESLDLREHPTKYRQMSSKKLKALREKCETRTITKEEYKRLQWQKRLTTRRNKAVKEFWKAERDRINHKLPATRNWKDYQLDEIKAGKIPSFNGRKMASHHLYSVSKYPHLADRQELIFPATFTEHIFGFHGGNTRNSLPGVPINDIKEF